jgi:hypothetical protein
MNRNLMNRLSIAAVALVLVLPFTAGCSNSSGGLVQNPLVASFSGDMNPIVDNSVSLQPGTAGSSDTFKVDVTVGAIDGVNALAVKIHFNRYFVEFVSGDFSASFLQGALAGTEFDTGAMLFSPGVVDVYAARRGATVAGIPMAAGSKEVLCTLTFKAIAAVGSNTEATGALEFDEKDNMITVCPLGGGACTQATVTFGGGHMTAQ